jgi:RNA polymerase sigma factor (sigma-70 family)
MSLALKATPPAPTCTEHELVAAVRDGSDPAFEELYARYQSRISSYICGLVDDHARAEDIAQEVFISALRRLRVTERPIAFKAWIYEIAKNACIDEFRRTRRTREVPLEPEPGGAETDPRLVSDTPSPDAAIESKQSLRHLTGAFHGLSENHHRVIVMREFEGLSYDEIGERLGMTRPVVESTLFRARRRLSQEYNELVSGRRCQQVHALIAAEEPESLLKLGVRQRRQLARHLAHCQPCRRHARLAGVDDSLFHAPSLVGKIAAWLPIPWLWRRAAQRDGADGTDKHKFIPAQSWQSMARFGELAGASTGFGRAAAAAAAVGLAGLGGGIVTGVANQSHPAALRPIPAVRSYRSGPTRPAVRRQRPAKAVAGAHRPNGTARRRSGGSGGPATKTRTPAAGGGGAPAASGAGSAAGSSSRGSALGGASPKLPGVSVPGVGSGAAPGVPSLPKLPAPKLPVPTQPSPPPSVQVPSLPKPPPVTTPTVPAVSAPPAPKLPKASAPSLPKVSAPSIPKASAPSLPKVSHP